jgi:hypothetical protein
MNSIYYSLRKVYNRVIHRFMNDYYKHEGPNIQALLPEIIRDNKVMVRKIAKQNIDRIKG